MDELVQEIKAVLRDAAPNGLTRDSLAAAVALHRSIGLHEVGLAALLGGRMEAFYKGPPDTLDDLNLYDFAPRKD